jgi:hypothetical protein
LRLATPFLVRRIGLASVVFYILRHAEKRQNVPVQVLTGGIVRAYFASSSNRSTWKIEYGNPNCFASPSHLSGEAAGLSSGGLRGKRLEIPVGNLEGKNSSWLAMVSYNMCACHVKTPFLVGEEPIVKKHFILISVPFIFLGITTCTESRQVIISDRKCVPPSRAELVHRETAVHSFISNVALK